MFGRKRKQEEDNLGLSAPIVSPPATTSPTVSVSAAPTPTPTAAPTPTPTSPATAPPTPPTTLGSMPTNNPAMLAEILSGHGPIGELITQIKADPQAFRERIMAQAQAAGVSTYVLTPGGLNVSGPGSPQHVDVVDELTKAADLHDKGALTDAEFEQMKKKLLGE